MVYGVLVAILLIAAILVTFRSNATLRDQARSHASGGKETGSFEDYLARIESLASEGRDDFFVVAAEVDGPRFVQVSAGRGRDGTLGYQFDIPSVPWSHSLVGPIATEAEKRGRRAVFNSGTDGMQFLDIDFPTSGEHAVFARWVVTEIFGHTQDTRYEIEWG